MMSNNILNIGVNNWWKGYQVIVIDEVPGEIPAVLLNVLFSRCQRLGVSLELCVFSAEDKRRLSVAFVLRCEGASRYDVQGLLGDLTQSILPQLQEIGFRAHLAAEDDPVVLHLDSFFTSPKAKTHVGKGFFPEDRLLGTSQFYVPGKYDRDSLLPISWEQLARVLTRYPMSMMCIQLVNTSLSAGECKYLKDCKGYFAALNTQDTKVSEEDRRAVGEARLLYEQLLGLAGKPLFFVNCFCVGSALFADDMSALMRTWQYRTFTLEPQMLQQGNYLCLGDRMAKTEIYGHMERCVRRFRLTPQFQRLTHMVTPKLAAELFPLPSSTKSIAGLGVKRTQAAPVLLPETAVYQENSRMVCLGTQAETGVRLGISLGDLRRHGFIVGKSGCGKTTFAMGFLHQLYRLGIPFLVVEPAKCEYRSLLSAIDDLRIYTPGQSGISPIQLNPFMPPKGVTLEEYLPALATIFNAAIAMDHPLDVILPQVIRICYNQHGWRANSTRDSQGVQPFGMTEFIRCYQDYINQAYADNQEARSNLESGGVVRLGQLIAEYPLLFDTNNTLDFAELFKHPTVIELDSVSNDQQRSLIMMTILMQVKLAVRKTAAMDGALRQVIMIDEAHLLLGNSGGASMDGKLDSASHCIRELQDAIKIFRSYGTGVFFGDQNPEKLTRDIMEHVNLKIMFQQDSPHNRAVLAELTRMDGVMQEDMIDLPPGCGYVFLDRGLTKPVKFNAPDYKRTLALSGVSDEVLARKMHTEFTPPFRQCAGCESCANRCTIPLRMDAKFIAERLLNSHAFSDALTQQESGGIFAPMAAPDESAKRREQSGRIRAYFSGPFAEAVAACMKEQAMNWQDIRQVHMCVKVQMIRGLLLNKRCLLTEDELMQLLAEEAEA